jgi:hypothetical protein
MRRAENRCTPDSTITAPPLRGLSKPASYPVVERDLWRGRVSGLFAALRALQGQRRQQEPEVQTLS